MPIKRALRIYSIIDRHGGASLNHGSGSRQVSFVDKREPYPPLFNEGQQTFHTGTPPGEGKFFRL